MLLSNRAVRTYKAIDGATMSVEGWNTFIKALALAFLAYWLHLHHGLNDWLGTGGFHLPSQASALFAPLPSIYARLLWWVTLLGAFLLFIPRTVPCGCIIVGCGLFYATLCDPASVGALNMHFLFAVAVIFWSTSLSGERGINLMAWPAYLIRLYLVVVYFGSGWRKVIYGNWSDNPHALLDCITGYYTTDLTRRLYPLLPSFAWTALQYLTFTFELGAPLLLLYPPLRKQGVLLGCLLHLGIALLMRDLFYFSFQMMTFYIPVLIPTYLDDPISKRGHHSGI